MSTLETLRSSRRLEPNIPIADADDPQTEAGFQDIKDRLQVTHLEPATYREVPDRRIDNLDDHRAIPAQLSDDFTQGFTFENQVTITPSELPLQFLHTQLSNLDLFEGAAERGALS